MSIFRKIELMIGGLLLLAVILLSAYSVYLNHRRDSLQADYQQAAANAYAGNTAAKELKTIVIEKENAHAELDQALSSSPAWANGTVPDDVADLLRHDSGSARAVPR